MKLNQVLLCVLLSMLVASSEALKVIFARNTTAQAIREAEAERIKKQAEFQTVEGTIINVPQSCKPGFVYESTFHNRCRKVVG